MQNTETYHITDNFINIAESEKNTVWQWYHQFCALYNDRS